MSVNGYCDPKFSRVEEYFEKSINSKFELGASISIEIEGETVLNLWGGFKDAKHSMLWEEDTLCNTFSVSKAMTTACILKLIQEENKIEALKLLNESYNSLLNKEIYETFDYAEFLKNNEKFKESIPLYTKIINQIESNHPLYTEVTDGRGVAYERIGEWDKAELDLLASLKVNPDQAYVIND